MMMKFGSTDRTTKLTLNLEMEKMEVWGNRNPHIDARTPHRTDKMKLALPIHHRAALEQSRLAVA